MLFRSHNGHVKLAHIYAARYLSVMCVKLAAASAMSWSLV
jgi:hypothetical protein